MDDLISRPATRGDLERLVDFVLMAGDGLPDLTWAAMAQEGESLRDVGLRRAARNEGVFSWRNATIFERSGEPVGGLVGTRLPDDPVPINADFPRPFVSLQELENLVCGSWYVNILGVYPEARGQGIGSAMLDRADEIARQSGAAGTSIIVFSPNAGAERLYRRSGYGEVARRRLAVPGWRHDGCEAILLAKPLAT